MTVPIGLVIGFLTLRLGDLYVALVTLTFGLLMDSVVFNQNIFYQFGFGVNVPRPCFAQSDLGYTYLTLAVFCIIALLIVNLRGRRPDWPCLRCAGASRPPGPWD